MGTLEVTSAIPRGEIQLRDFLLPDSLLGFQDIVQISQFCHYPHQAKPCTQVLRNTIQQLFANQLRVECGIRQQQKPSVLQYLHHRAERL